MLQTLFSIPTTIFGVPIFGVGVVLAVIVLWTAFAVWSRVARVGFDGEATSTLIFGGIASAFVVFVVPNLVGDAGFPVRGYGFFLLIAIVTSFGLLVCRRENVGLSVDDVMAFVLWGVVGGIAGARIFYIAQYWQTLLVVAPTGSLDFPATTWKMVNLTEGGLVVYGSLIGGAATVITMTLMRRLPVLKVCDWVIPAVAFGMAIGRLGCLMNGCCYGEVCSPEYGIVFPVGSPAHYEQVARGLVDANSGQVLPVYPTQLYSAAGLAILGAILLALDFVVNFAVNKQFANRYAGIVLAAFLLLEPPMRFVLEIFRADEKSFWITPMTISQNVAVMMFAVGVVLMAFVVRRGSRRSQT
ncbi:MAG: prolipoprotein diacylglyceryl transferase [Thermoguttaceae bacterium]